jgi:hypothetical protein
MIKKPNLTTRAVFSCLGLILLSACTKLSETEQSDIIGKKKWTVSTVAGSATAGFTDGDSTQAQFNNAQGIITDNKGNLFIGDIGNASIRQVTYAGHVSTYTGKNIGNPDPLFGNIYGLVRDNQGNIYDIEYDLIRKIVSPTNNSILAGAMIVNYADGTGANANFHMIANMAIDSQGNIFLPDYDMQDNFRLRKVTPDGVVSTLALTDNTGFPSSGLPNYHYLYSVAVDAAGNIYVTANGNCMIKKIDPSGNVTILAGKGDVGFVDGKGTAAQFNTILGMACDASGNLWVCDGSNHAIRLVTPDGTVTTIAGTGSMGYKDGDAAQALFKFPFGITVDKDGVIFIMDNGNNRVRKLEFK